mmetsp:Transcript_61079/g.133756  ORF Transcript_61079/g.133756 Transcript_61079/m.133756 type:complete len:413 (-) Transcript_61079:43-1281(-)
MHATTEEVPGGSSESMNMFSMGPRRSVWALLGSFAAAFGGWLVRTHSNSTPLDLQAWRVSPQRTEELGRCTMERLDLAAWNSRFLKDYHLKKPAILVGWSPEWVQALKDATRPMPLLERFGTTTVLTGRPRELVRDGQKKARQEERLQDYVASMPGSTYLFDDGSFLRSSGLDRSWETAPGLDALGTFNDWSNNKTSYLAGSTQPVKGPLVTFSLGSTGQGVAFHIHGDSYNLHLHGRKQWAIYAPGKMPRTGFSRSETFEDWLRLRRQGPDFTQPEWECIQEAGEVLYIPEGFYHGTSCVEDCVGAVHQVERLTPGTSFERFVASRKGTPSEAVSLLREALKLDGTNSDYWMELGVLYASAGRLGEAIACLEKSLDLNPLNEDARSNLASLYVRGGRRLDAARLRWERLWL